MSYGGDPANDASDALRLKVGDTNLADEQLTDAEVAYCLTLHTDGWLCAAEGADILQAKYARMAVEEVGDAAQALQSKSDNYAKLARVLRSKADPGHRPIMTGSAGGTDRYPIFCLDEPEDDDR